MTTTTRGSAAREVECELCRGVFAIDPRRLREHRQREEPVFCRVCKLLAKLERAPAPDVSQFYGFWFEAFPGGAIDELLVDVFGAAALEPAARARREMLRASAAMASAA